MLFVLTYGIKIDLLSIVACSTPIKNGQKFPYNILNEGTRLHIPQRLARPR